ncbi:MAG: MBL fold metallo-hydrolase [bacterium]
MFKISKYITVCLAVLFLGPSFADAADTIRIIYDSETRTPGLRTGWGFSAVVTVGKRKLLVDTGWDPEIFGHNMKAAGYSPADFDLVIISHWHPDHAGGLRYLLGLNPEIETYVPSDIPGDYAGFYPFNTVKKQLKVAPNVYIFQTNPDNPRFRIKEELSLVVKTSQGPVIVSGCFHTGWPRLLKAVGEVFPEKPYLMVGGGRFIDLDQAQLTKLAGEIKGLGLQKVGLSHCAAGPLPESVFEKFYPGRSVYARLGAVINLP